jgi:hypothetical protein
MCPQGRHSYRVFSVFWPVMEATVYNWRPHVFQLPLPIAYIKLEWLLVADTLPASEFGKYEVMSLLRAEQGGGGGSVPAAGGSDSRIPEPAVHLLRHRRAAAGLCCFIPA